MVMSCMTFASTCALEYLSIGQDDVEAKGAAVFALLEREDGVGGAKAARDSNSAGNIGGNATRGTVDDLRL